MYAWQIDDPAAYKFVVGVQKAIRHYFNTRESELEKSDNDVAMIMRCENTRAWAAITDILYGNIEVDDKAANAIGDYIHHDDEILRSMEQEDAADENTTEADADQSELR